MQWGVKLQNPFSYHIYGFIILILVTIIVLIMIITKHLKEKPKKIIIKEEIKDINKLKKEYLTKIDNLVNNINNQKTTQRKAYNELRKIIREFVFKTTNIDVLKYTLSEIKQINNKELLELINEFYEPEFSVEGKGNITKSIEKTRKVINEWK